uniref:Uncharacterized protein n=1 Tax=viral metagenome TaxID=1070528 RepID=A0A6C0DSI6_9ZZZZ
MGASHSVERDIIDVQNKLIGEFKKKEEVALQQIAQLVEPVAEPEWVNWEPSALTCVLCSGTREDGSTYKELYVPKWGVVFFEESGLLGVREQPACQSGSRINIYEAQAILLHNAYMKWCEYRKAARIGLAALASLRPTGGKL